jgi:hypothetical protein
MCTVCREAKAWKLSLWRDGFSLRLPISKLQSLGHAYPFSSNFFYKAFFDSLRSGTMSTASKVTLAGTILGTIGIVGFVHWAQTAEKAVSYM